MKGVQLVMKSRRQADWSFLLMRGAEHSVKQFTVKKRSLVATPVALLAIVSGVFIGMKLQAASQIKELQLQLASLSHQYEQSNLLFDSTISQHQSTILSLEQQLEAAYDKQKLIDAKLAELNELEKQLEQFMTDYGSQTPLELDRQAVQSDYAHNQEKALYTIENEEINSSANVSPNNTNKLPKVTALSYTLDEHHTLTSETSTEQLANYAALHELPIEDLSKIVDNFVEVMHYNLHKAGKIRENVDSFPDYWPAVSKMTTSGFGYRLDPFTKSPRLHAGIDIDGQSGDVIFSAGDGVVIEASYDANYGYYIIIEHSDSLKTLYGHLSSIEAKKGDKVVKGEKIGKMGSSGRSTGSHLHFQVMLNNQPVSPLKYINKTN